MLTRGRLTLCLAALTGLLQAEPKRELYAHYMGCFPSALGAISYHQREAATNLHFRTSYSDHVGGRIVNWPLLPERLELSAEENAELEIRRAMRAGVDGFAVDAWAGREGAKEQFKVLIRTAEKMQVPFKLTICFDPSCHPQDQPMLDAFVDTAKFVLQFKDSPNLARRNGDILFFTYYASHIVPKQLRPNDDLPVAMKNIASAWMEFRKRVEEPIFLHGCLESIVALAARADRETPVASGAPTRMRVLGDWAGETFETAGGFLADAVGRWRFDTNLVAGVKASGAGWSQPLFWQYNNKAGGVISGAGLELLRENWTAAMEADSTLLQFVTWNDYAEESILAPAYGSNYTISRINRYYADWWKTGIQPAVMNDEVHVVFRKYCTDGDEPVLTYPFSARNNVLPNVLEVITLATAPGHVEVAGYGEYSVPVGISWKQFPLTPGRVKVILKRGLLRRTVVEVTAPEEVSEKPWREDFTQVAYGSNFESEWAADFRDVPPLKYSEYGDVDGDGLPNWFEMLYFGQYPFMSTATHASASADPDGDGFTNLQEFHARTNPLAAEIQYAIGDSWQFADISTAPAFFNPTRDTQGQAVWWVFYKFGEKRKVDLDGNYEFCRSSGGAPQRKGISTPHNNPFGSGSHLTFNTNGTFHISGRQESAILVGWKSPVDGVVDFEMEATTGRGHGTVRLILAKGAGEQIVLASESAQSNVAVSLIARDVQVQKGDFLYFIPDYRDTWGLGACEVFSLEVTLRE